MPERERAYMGGERNPKTDFVKFVSAASSIHGISYIMVICQHSSAYVPQILLILLFGLARRVGKSTQFTVRRCPAVRSNGHFRKKRSNTGRSTSSTSYHSSLNKKQK
ncbi:hypothetical protein TNCV_4405661 [Trichonephila clavipes]|uniref:Uncharacterized protein n=1 Tax=Trichonephila clavipes TaxID=2585209 RepID=A0A8X6SCF3_TRICX|nr:hypothetical protein TNCV_4405661 [Trichonephila clavipes]